MTCRCLLPPQGGSSLKSVLLLMFSSSAEVANMATSLARKVINRDKVCWVYGQFTMFGLNTGYNGRKVGAES